MFRRDGYRRIEKSENNNKQKDLANSSIKRGFRKALYGDGDPSSHAQQPWKDLEYLVKEENTSRIKELQWKGSKDWNEKWNTEMEIRRLLMEQQKREVPNRSWIG